ncbi:hypothetical protein PMAYCL1PPCAC_04066, partial [Pristionchus mayeri]
ENIKNNDDDGTTHIQCIKCLSKKAKKMVLMGEEIRCPVGQRTHCTGYMKRDGRWAAFATSYSGPIAARLRLLLPGRPFPSPPTLAVVEVPDPIATGPERERPLKPALRRLFRAKWRLIDSELLILLRAKFPDVCLQWLLEQGWGMPLDELEATVADPAVSKQLPENLRRTDILSEFKRECRGRKVLTCDRCGSGVDAVSAAGCIHPVRSVLRDAVHALCVRCIVACEEDEEGAAL